MAQVMYDRAIKFADEIYSVTQTWDGPRIDIKVNPENESLRQLIIELLGTCGQITLSWQGGYFEIVLPSELKKKVWADINDFREKLAASGRVFSDSVESLQEDRER